MLVVSETTQEALADHARPAFAARLREPLAAKYADILTRFPQHVQAQIVNHMLGRAELWGLNQQRSCLAFCEFMLKIAPNFDEEPEIRAALQRGFPTRDRAVISLPDDAGEAAWSRAQLRRSNLPLYIPAELAGAPILDQTVAALPVVLFDRPPQPSARVAVEQALPTVQTLGMRGLADAPLVVCVCRAFWGVDFMNQAWAQVLLREHFPPELVLSALRLRLAQDYGRYV